MFTNKNHLHLFLMVGVLCILVGCMRQEPSPSQRGMGMPAPPRYIDAKHTYGRLYTVAIGDSAGGGGATTIGVMILTKPDCTGVSSTFPAEITLSVGDTTGGGGNQ